MNGDLGDALSDLGAVPVFDGPELSCPVCAGALEQLALALDLEGLSPAACHDCGAVLAA
jgi:hypothetical protein